VEVEEIDENPPVSFPQINRNVIIQETLKTNSSNFDNKLSRGS
jgi:hypothetical protein